MSSVNKVILVGNVGADPEIRSFDNGDRVANLSLATSESWKDKNTGERREKTEWHRVVVFGKLVDVIEQYVSKGSKLYFEGKLETRKWEKDGQDRYSTEVVLRGFDSKMVMLDSKSSSPEPSAHDKAKADGYQPQPDPLEDEIPF